MAWRAGGADASGAGAVCTSGLAAGDRSVTSLISSPSTSGPATGGRGGRVVIRGVRGGAWGVRDRDGVVRAGAVD